MIWRLKHGPMPDRAFERCLVKKSRRISFLTEILTLEPSTQLHKMKLRQQLPQTSNNDLPQKSHRHKIVKSDDLRVIAVFNLSPARCSDLEVVNFNVHS